MTKEVIVYGRSEPPCPFCVNMKKALSENQVEYKYLDILNEEVLTEFNKLGVRTVPQCIVNGENLGGFDNIRDILIFCKEEDTSGNIIKTVIKSDGSEVPFDADKLNKKARWAAARKVNWSSVALGALRRLQDKCSVRDIDKAIIDTCVEMFDEKSFMLAGRVLAGVIYKEAYGGFKKIPTIKEHHDNMGIRGYWENLPYSHEEFSTLEEVIDHGKDLTYSYPEIKQISDKYVIRNRVEEVCLESPQMMYMGMAMANMKLQPADRRIEDVIKLYHYLSDKKICAPTPFMTNLRTPSRSFASCCVYTTEDEVGSLATGDHIAYMMTVASAGIGSHLKTRSKGDNVRKGTTVHQGKRPYYKVVETAVAANLQNGRGGSATMHVNVLDPEIEDIIKWKSKKTATKIRVDGIHYSIGYNLHFAKKVKQDDDWKLISLVDAPELYEAMYEGDQTKFVELYESYEGKHKKVKARTLALEVLIQGQESGQVYLHRTDEMNRHTPFKDKIYSSNLCQEIALPTKGYGRVDDLYKEEESGEIGLCNVAAIVARRVSAEEYPEVAYYTALMVDNVIDIMDYPFANLKLTAQARRSLAIGVTDLAGHMAEKKLKYSSVEGKKYLHTHAELHSFSLIKASLRLAKEKGACEWIGRTKWADGWLPIDTMNVNIGKKVGQELLLDWEGLREEIKVVGGLRNSVVGGILPNESSSIATNGTNSILPARSIKTVKTNGTKKTRFLVPNSDTLSEEYELAWDIDTKDLFDVYAIYQRFIDQAISADQYLDFTKKEYSGMDLLSDFLYMTSVGMKTRYYVTSKTNSGTDGTKSKQLVEEIEDTGACSGGGCVL